MKIDTYNTKGQKIGTTELPDRIFGVRWNAALVKQVYDGERANARNPWAHTKDRSEVRGGGRKPWRQKGLGRARHGSIRSPIWIGGGVAHGPRKERSFEVKINKKMKSASVRALLSRKLSDGQIIMFDAFVLSAPKTKEATRVFQSLGAHDTFKNIATRAKILFAIPRDSSVMRATRNLPRVFYTEPRNMTTTALLHTSYVVLDQSSLTELITIFA